MNTWQDVIYRSVLEYALKCALELEQSGIKENGVAADLAMKDFEGDPDGQHQYIRSTTNSNAQAAFGADETAFRRAGS